MLPAIDIGEAHSQGHRDTRGKHAFNRYHGEKTRMTADYVYFNFRHVFYYSLQRDPAHPTSRAT